MKCGITINQEVSKGVCRFYRKLAQYQDINYVDLPRAMVYYVRWQIWEDTGIWHDVDMVAVSLWMEGFLPPNDVTKIPQEYITKYFNGKEVSFEKLKKLVVKKYFKNLIDKVKEKDYNQNH